MKRLLFSFAFTLCLLLQTSEPVFAGNSYHASLSGTPSGSGSITSPLDGRTASLRTSFQPGDTVWFHGGTYVGEGWQFMPNGTSTLPIVYRNWNNERVVFSGQTGNDIIGYVKGNYCWLWGFEILSTVAVANQAGLQMGGTGSKLINCYVHDTQTTGVTSQQSSDTEIYGTLFQYCGRFIPPPPASVSGGYSIYTQNVIGAGMKWVRDCILMWSYGPSLHVYTQGATISNMGFDGDIVSGSGYLWRANEGPSNERWEANFLAGSTGIPGDNLVLTNNIFYHDRRYPYGKNYLTLYSNCTNATLKGNRFISPNQGIAIELDGTASVNEDNFVLGSTNLTAGTNNTFLSAWPSTRATEVVVTPNKYESGRANITVLNWTGASTVSVNLSSVLAVGSQYRIVDAMNFYGPAIASGTYSGGTVSLSMAPGPVAAPLGNPAHMPTETTDFRVFVLLGGANPLPIALKYFDARYVAPAVKVEWETLTESYVYRFYLVRNGVTLTTLPPHGPGIYTVLDTVLAGTYKYQLIQVDLSGYSTYFDPVTVTVPTTSVSPERRPIGFGIIGVYPNPFNATARVVFELQRPERIRFTIYSPLGRDVFSVPAEQYPAGLSHIDITLPNLPSGFYFLRMMGGRSATAKIIMVK